jgi:glycerophosphoryl diester phosphodiesterase
VAAEAEWLVVKPVAHRGLHDLARGVPENSLPAFEMAAERGIPAELDVRLLSDGTPVVFHDVRLERATGLKGSISAQDRESLKRFMLNGTEETIPLFEEVLEAVGGRAPLLIEVKADGAPDVLGARMIDALRGYEGEFAVQSFSPSCLSWFRKHAPGVRRGQIAGDLRGPASRHHALQRFLLLHLMLNSVGAPDFIAYDLRFIERRALRVWREKGLPTLAWTIRNAQEEARARSYCDNIIFEGYMPRLSRALPPCG